jgi:hypothetical protein
MWCKDTSRIGDAGASSALLAIAAGPVFSDEGEQGYNPFGPSRQLFAGPVYAAPTFGGACDTPDGVCDMNPNEDAQPLPSPVTMDTIDGAIDDSCALHYCTLDVGGYSEELYHLH